MSKLAPEGGQRTTEPMVELHDIFPEGAHEDPRDAYEVRSPILGDSVVADAPAPAPTEEANAADSAVPEPGPGSESEGAPEAKGEEEDDAESGAAPALPAGPSLLDVCGHPGVTIEALRARGSEAAAQEKDEVRARPSPRRECAPSRRVTPRSLSRSVRSMAARLCTSCAGTRTRPPR